MIIWSKFKIDETLEREEIVEKFRYRFKNILPVMDIDLVIHTKAPPVVEKAVEE